MFVVGERLSGWLRGNKATGASWQISRRLTNDGRIVLEDSS